MRTIIIIQPRTLSEAAQTQGHALQVGIQRKLASNLQYCRDAGLSCAPLVAETLGGLAEDFISTIQVIGRSIRLRSGADRDTDTSTILYVLAPVYVYSINHTRCHHGNSS